MHRTFITTVVAVVFMIIPFVLQADECQLMMMVSNGSDGFIPDDTETNILEEFREDAAGSDEDDGWGLLNIPTGDSYSANGYVWIPQFPDPLGYRRWGGYEQANNPNSHYIEAAAAIVAHKNKIIIGHLRAADSGSGGSVIPDPHPFLYETSKSTIAFAQHGSPGETVTGLMIGTVEDLISRNGWNDSQLEDLIYQDIDSGVYFGYLIAYMKLNDFDILRGLHQAMNSSSFGGNWNKNFVMTDGFDGYAYRETGSTDQDHNLYFGRTLGSQPTYVVKTVMPGGTMIDIKELVYFSNHAYPIHFKGFSGTTGGRVGYVKYLEPVSSSTNYWCWESFPVMNPGESSINTMTQSGPNTSGDGFGSAIRVNSVDPLEYMAIRSGVWEIHNLGNFDQTLGYKILCSDDSDFTGEVKGTIVSGDATVTLYPGQDNWIGYWLLNSQSLRDAMGNDFSSVAMVEAETFCYKAPSGRGLGSTPTIDIAGLPVEFGKMYNIILKEGITSPITFSWTNSRMPYQFGTIPQPTFFTYENAPEYEVIDVASVENGDDIKEIGVFAEDTCIGASVVESFPVQILVYTDDYENTEIEFQYYTGDRAPILSGDAVAVWDENKGGFSAGKLVAGDIGYKTVTLGGKPQPISPTVDSFELQVSPNPFNPETTISLSLPADGELEVSVFNIRGQKVNTIARGQYAQGEHKLVWDGKDANNRSISSGVYFLRVTTAGQSVTRKLLLLK